MASYLLSYDFTTTAPLRDQLLAFVKANRLVTQWSHPYMGLYLLKSTTDVWTLAASFQEFFTKQHSHIIVPLDGDNSQGVLPTSVWNWINAPEASPLANYLGQLAIPPPPPKS